MNRPQAVAQQIDFHHPELHSLYDQVKISPKVPRSIRHEHLVELLQKLKSRYPKTFGMEHVGESVEGRSIYLISIGSGPRSVLMWSQMHGNEPTATNALLDMFNYLLGHHDDEFVQDILQGITLYAIPMLNPDGAEHYHRRNAQGLDINRDARDQATPEGRILKSVHHRIRPEFGFNLHDQNGRRTVGNTNKIVAIALLVPPFDENENDNPTRVDAKRVASLIYQSLTPYIYGHIARYDATYMPRAFGDNIQKWGTRTVLVEAGGWFEGEADFLVRMNFIALLEACYAIATGSYQQANPGLYDALPQNDKELFDLLIRDVMILDGIRSKPYKGDIGVNYTESLEENQIVYRGRITDIGDMDLFAAKDTIDADGYLALPGLIGYLPKYDSATLPDAKEIDAHLRRGYTNLVLPHPIDASKSVREAIAYYKKSPMPMNLGFVLPLSDLAKIKRSEQATYLGDALSEGALAVLSDSGDANNLHPLVKKITHWLHREIVPTGALAAEQSWPQYLAVEQYHVSRERAKKLGIIERGTIQIGDFADMAIYKLNGKQPTEITDADLAYVLVNGRVAYAAERSVNCMSCGVALVR